MVEVREMVRRWLGGEGVRAIARATGMDSKTIGAYVRAARAVGVERGGAPPTDEQLTTIAATPARGARRTRQPRVPSSRRSGRMRPRFGSGSGRRCASPRSIAGSAPRGCGCPTALYRFARTTCDFGRPALTVRVADPPPGEVAETDFGVLGQWPDPTTGRRRRVYGLLVTLVFSRYAFLAITLRQDLLAVLDGLEAAWAFFGGVVRRLVVDNLTPAVTRPDRYTPTLNRVFLEYAQYRGFVVDPAVPAHPTGKPRVERGIPYARQDFFRGESFQDVTAMQARLPMSPGWPRTR
jgi:transposase